MGVVYSPEKGLQRIEYSCGARVGDYVKAWDAGYEVIGIDDYGCYVCRNLSEDCLAHEEIRTFDDLDIDEVISPPVGNGDGI